MRTYTAFLFELQVNINKRNFLIFFIAVNFVGGCSENKKQIPIKKYNPSIQHVKKSDTLCKSSGLYDYKPCYCNFNYKNETYKITIIPKDMGRELILLKEEDTLYKNYYHFNLNDSLITLKKDLYLLPLLNSGGGSGFEGTVFRVQPTLKTPLYPVFTFNELTNYVYYEKQNKIIVMDGIWNFGGVDDTTSAFEYHFADHVQLLSIVYFKSDTCKVVDLGYTKFKYDSFDWDSTLSKLQKQEPELYLKLGIHE